MGWQQLSNCWVYQPETTDYQGIIHFLGGAFVGTTPQLTYRWLLEEIGKAGFVIVATPFLNTLDHQAIARKTLNQFQRIITKMRADGSIPQAYLPVYGLGHSMGCKLHLLINSVYNEERSGNILVSYNNYPIRKAIPLVEQWDLDQTLNLEFTPSAEETKLLISEDYSVRRNLLIRFNNDDIDETIQIKPLLKQKFPNMISMLTIPGNHLTPITQDFDFRFNNEGKSWETINNLGQLLRQSFSRDLKRLKEEILLWLRPNLNLG
jgi:hypothetical protein